MTKLTSNLCDKAILVSLRISGWRATVYDQQVSAEIARLHNASPDAGRYTKVLLPKEVLQPVQHCESMARKAHYLLTLPWDQRGYRLLPILLYAEYRQQLDHWKEARVQARQQLLARYAAEVAAAALRLGDMFRPGEYLSGAALERRLVMEYSFLPVPDAAHFVADLAEEEAQRIRADLHTQLAAQLRGGVQDLYDRLQEAVSQCQDRLALDPDGTGRVFRDTMLTRLRELTRVVPQLNITDDPRLADMCAQIQRALDGVASDHLRVTSPAFDPAAHRRVSTQIDDLSDQFAGYFGGITP